MPRGRPKGFNREHLAREIRDVLELPTGHNMRCSTAYKIAGTIIKVIVDALKRGESVEIPGFGIFRWYTKPATRSSCVYYYHVDKKVRCLIRDIPPKKFVKFYPSKVLIRFINEEQHES